MQRPSHSSATGVGSSCFLSFGSDSCATAEPSWLPRSLDVTAWNDNPRLLCNGRAYWITTGVGLHWISCSILLLVSVALASPSLRQRPSVKFHSVVDFACFALSLEFCEVICLVSSWLHIITSKCLQIAPNIRKTPKKNQSKSNWHN